MSDALTAEDEKLVTLARSARARTAAEAGAAVRDDTGRTYVAVGVALPSLTLTALQAAVAAAVASGATNLEGAAVVTSGGIDEEGSAAVRDLAGPQCLLIYAEPSGSVSETVMLA